MRDSFQVGGMMGLLAAFVAAASGCTPGAGFVITILTILLSTIAAAIGNRFFK